MLKGPKLNREEQRLADSQPPVMERGRRADAPAGERRSGSRRGRRLPRVLALLMVLGFGLVVARQEIPAVADWWARTFTPAEWGVRQTCRQAVQEELGDHRYLRLLRDGGLHHTQDGPYVTQMRFSVLGEEGGETTVTYQCYLDNNGRVFRLKRGSE